MCTRIKRATAVLCLAASLTFIGASAQAQNPPPGMSLPVSTVQPEVAFPNGVTGLMDVTYAEVRGYRPLKLDLYYQANDKKPKPAVVWLHGGGWSGGNPRMGVSVIGTSDQVLSALAARGYVAAGVSYRLTGEATFPAAIQDVKASIRWLRANAAKYNIDPQRIAVWGESAGGYLAALAGTSCGAKDLEGQGGNAEQSSCLQAVIDWYGPTDFTAMDAQAGPNAQRKHSTPDSAESTLMGCELSKCSPALLKMSNPIAYVSDKTPPFLIMHGDADAGVPMQQSQMLYEALKAKGVKAKIEIVPGVGHLFAGASPAQSKSIMKSVQQFLDENFQVKAGK